MDLMEEVGRYSAADIAEFYKEEAEDKVVPKGRYEGTVYTWNEVPDEKKRDDDEYKGVPIYRVGVRCYDYPEVGKSKIAWVKVSGVKVLNAKGKKKAASASGLMLTHVMGMPDALITDVLDQAKVIRAVYTIEVWNTKNKDHNPADPNSPEELPGGNWLKEVRAL